MNTHADHIDWGAGAKDGGVAAAVRDFVTVAEGRYILGLGGTGIEFEIDRLRRKFDELTGELTVRCRKFPGARTFGPDDVLSVADLNLSSLRSRKERADHLAVRSQAPDVDWYGLLEEFCQRVLTADRSGGPAVLLRDVARPAPDSLFDVDGLRLPRVHPAVLFGDGGAGKSYLALYIAGQLARRGLSVLFADWEFSGDDHRERLERLFGANMPDVRYVRCDRPLVVEARAARRPIGSRAGVA
jgi:hypothetical protein